jgi:ABC-type transport system involved in multi-copper enzyme maturation permease subunit
MTCYPLIERELQLALRRRFGSYKVRLLCAAGSMATAFWILFVWSAWNPTAGFGRPFLHLLTTLGYIGALFSGIVLIADSISREKREGTLDLLLLTDLRLGDVVLGKILAQMIVPIYGFVAMVPALELSIFVGGTTAGECARMLLVWTNALFFSLAVSSLISALAMEQRTAHAGSMLGVVLAAVALPYLGALASAKTGHAFWQTAASLFSPTGPVQFGQSYGVMRAWFWSALLANQVSCWLLLILAHLILKHSVRRRSSGPVWAAKPAPPGAEPGPLPRRREAPLLDAHPIQWLASRSLGVPTLLWATCLATFVIVGLGYGRIPDELMLVLLAAAHLGLKFAVASSATHAFAADRRSGALESLLGTAVGVPEIASGMCRVLWRRFTGPMFILASATLLQLWGMLEHSGRGSTEQMALLFLGTALLPLDVYCLCWDGLFQGLAARTPTLALGTTFIGIVGLPWAWLLIASPVLRGNSFGEWVILWALVTPINHWWFVSNSKAKFLRHFRTLALKPFGEKGPIMASEWSPINWEEDEPAAVKVD